jgi:hypothetical protein
VNHFSWHATYSFFSGRRQYNCPNWCPQHAARINTYSAMQASSKLLSNQEESNGVFGTRPQASPTQRLCQCQPQPVQPGASGLVWLPEPNGPGPYKIVFDNTPGSPTKDQLTPTATLRSYLARDQAPNRHQRRTQSNRTEIAVKEHRGIQ